jgi:hypothetical protein
MAEAALAHLGCSWSGRPSKLGGNLYGYDPPGRRRG